MLVDTILSEEEISIRFPNIESYLACIDNNKLRDVMFNAVFLDDRQLLNLANSEYEHRHKIARNKYFGQLEMLNNNRDIDINTYIFYQSKIIVNNMDVTNIGRVVGLLSNKEEIDCIDKNNSCTRGYIDMCFGRTACSYAHYLKNKHGNEIHDDYEKYRPEYTNYANNIDVSYIKFRIGDNESSVLNLDTLQVCPGYRLTRSLNNIIKHMKENYEKTITKSIINSYFGIKNRIIEYGQEGLGHRGIFIMVPRQDQNDVNHYFNTFRSNIQSLYDNGFYRKTGIGKNNDNKYIVYLITASVDNINDLNELIQLDITGFGTGFSNRIITYINHDGNFIKIFRTASYNEFKKGISHTFKN